jgi:hypothetical protein
VVKRKSMLAARCSAVHQKVVTSVTDSNLRRNPVVEAGALPLRYVRVAGEIGHEPMASCASGRRSTHAELLAEFEVPPTDAVLTMTPLPCPINSSRWRDAS